MKKSLKFAILGLASLGMLASCNDQGSDFKVGFIYVGDDTEGYTKAHMEGIYAAAKKLGIPRANILEQKKIEENDNVVTAGRDLIANGAGFLASNSYGHQDYMKTLADEYPNIQMTSMTGDFAAICGSKNLNNAFTKIYEARYVSGVVGGLKLKELLDANKTTSKKIGYVGAYPYAEVISGYTAFFLGVQSIVPDATMEVRYTKSWFDVDKEANAAETLVNSGCVIIGQHADSTGAPTKCETLLKNGKVCYSVGYNIDMLSVAPNAALTSATNNWEVYYEYAMGAAMKGETIAKDWAEGYKSNAVGITKLGASCAEGTAKAVEEIETKLKAEKFHVFDTSKFTVKGEKVTTNKINLSYMDFTKTPPTVVYQGAEVETVKKDGEVTYIEESSVRSAPYFTLEIDGITQIK